MNLNPRIFILFSFVFIISIHAIEKSQSPCTAMVMATNGTMRDGCLKYRCDSGTVVKSLAQECVDLIDKTANKIIDEKLAERGIECSSKSEPPQEIGKYKIPGIIVAGGSWRNKVQLFKPDTKEICNLPKIPKYFSFSSINLVDGTPVLCGSWFASTSWSHMKNETEPREFFPVSSCVQLSPASKEAKWTIYTERLLDLRRDHVSLSTPDGILLMGGYDKRSVDLIKPDGSHERGVFELNRMIDRACGIEDAGTLIITGGGSNGRSVSVASKTVERYNRQGFVETLPDMNQARTDHGCGFFHKDGKKVLVVAGGYVGRYHHIQSTETFVLGSTSWTYSANLPSAMRAPASVSVNDMIYILFGAGRDTQIFRFDGDRWELTQTKYGWTSADDWHDGYRAIAIDLENSGFNEFCS